MATDKLHLSPRHCASTRDPDTLDASGHALHLRFSPAKLRQLDELKWKFELGSRTAVVKKLIDDACKDAN